MTRSQTPGDLSGFGSGRCFPASANRRCDHSRSGDAYWVLSQLPLCSPILAYESDLVSGSVDDRFRPLLVVLSLWTTAHFEITSGRVGPGKDITS
jgi:hypothetical protein